MQIKRVPHLLVLLGFLFPTGLQADNLQDQFRESVSLYDQGHFTKASEILTTMIEEGSENGHLYYNLGNTLFRMGKRGQAIAAWLKAGSLLPRDPDIAANLNYAASLNKDKLSWDRPVSAESMITFWQSWTTPREVFIGACLIFIFAMTGMIISRLKGDSLRPLKHTSLALLCLTVPAFMASGLSVNSQPKWGAVDKESAKVHSGPGDKNTVVFELHEGSPVNIRLSEHGWFLIELSDGKRGWISQKSVTFFE